MGVVKHSAAQDVAPDHGFGLDPWPDRFFRASLDWWPQGPQWGLRHPLSPFQAALSSSMLVVHPLLSSLAPLLVGTNLLRRRGASTHIAEDALPWAGGGGGGG